MKSSKHTTPHNQKSPVKSSFTIPPMFRDHLFFRIILVIFISCGGFYAAHNFFMAVALCSYAIYLFASRKALSFTPGFTDYAVYALVAAYCIGILTGIDKGMALTGASKFFCLLPFTLILMQLNTEEKRSLIGLIPFSGVLSVIACTVLLITPLREYVFIANRMSGFMGYANTFALLMLAGIMCEYFYGRKNPFVLIILSIGLFWSGSRTVFVMFIALVVFLGIRLFVIYDHYNIKHIIFAIIIFAIIVVISLFIPATSGIFKRLTDISFNSSTFQGRLLYMQDAFPLIKRFPMGLGAFGYSYVCRLTATGLYNVKYVHNSILQLTADTGVIPALMVMLISLVAWFKNKNYTVLFLFTHTLMDFDFEYISVIFFLIMIMEGTRKVPNAAAEQEKSPSNTKDAAKSPKNDSLTGAGALIPLVICCVFTVAATLPGLSNMLFLFDDPAAAIRVFPLNTEAREERMTNSYDINEIIDDVAYLIDHNAYNARAYQMAGTLAYLNGDAEQTVNYLTKEIELAPYAGVEYRSFASYLYDLAMQAEEAGDKKTYDYCVENLNILYDFMKEKEANISFLGGRISEQPALYLDQNAMSLIENSD